MLHSPASAAGRPLTQEGRSLAAQPARQPREQKAPAEASEFTAPPQRRRAPPPGDSPESAAALDLARRAVDLLSDKQADDILLLDIREVSLIADYFVIGTSRSERQTDALVRELRDRLQEERRLKPLAAEGRADSGWVILDYGDVVVHLFSPEQRTFYALEDLWAAATPVLRLQ